MPPRTTRAIVQTGPRRLELRELPVPDIDDDSGLLRIEACGICGSDAEQYAGILPAQWPLIPGHEPLGVIERIGDRAAKLWGAYADYMYLDPCSLVHRMRKDIPASLAVLFNPVGAGFRWAVELPHTGPG